MKRLKQIMLCGAAALVLTSSLAMAGSAAPATKEWLDPYNDAKFPLAKQVNIKLPQDYDANPSKDKVFSMSKDKPALAAVKTGATVELMERVSGKKFSELRSGTLLKDYVGVEMELIYEFKNGFKDFEFLGVCGQPGIWVGMFGKKNTIEFSYSDKLDGNYTAYDYMTIREIDSADSTRAYFRSSNVPTSARYLKITFKHGRDPSNAPEPMPEVDEHGYPYFWNWECGLGYLYVNEYVTAPGGDGGNNNGGGNNGGTDNGSANNGGGDNGGANNNGGGNNGTPASEPTVSGGETQSGGEVQSGETVSGVESADDTTQSGTGSESQTTTKKVTRVNWPAVIGAIAAAVVVIGGGVTALVIVLMKKKKAAAGQNAEEQDTQQK